MTSLPRLHHWEQTRTGLHRAAQVVGAFRKAFSPRLPNALHLALYLRRFGLTTGPLAFGHIDFYMAAGEVHVTVGDELWDIDLKGHSPKSLRAALVNGLNQHGISGELPANDDDTPFQVDGQQAAEYTAALWQISGALRELRADWLGAVTPLVVWPHGFDASQLWFPGAVPDEHSQPHLNFGFSPGSAGLPRPYVYAYAYPMPEGLAGTELPPLARWHTQGWTGVVIDYDTLALTDTPELELVDALRGVFAKLSARLDSRAGGSQ